MAHKERAGHCVCPGTILSALSVLLYCAGFIRVEVQLNDHENRLDSMKQEHTTLGQKDPLQRTRRSVSISPRTPNSTLAAKKQEIIQNVDVLFKLCQRSVGKACVRGPPGPPGETGAKGNRGNQGRRGQKGRKGRTGSQGIMGPPGRSGKQGMMGHPGIQGEKGDMGDAGPQGLPGPKGEPGESISSPHVIISPSTVTLNESVTARFLCSVTGNPRPRIQWTKEGGSLPGNRTTVTDLGELLIKNVGLEDSGRYKCSARNILGTAEGFSHLSVQARPRITLHIGPTYVAEKTNTTLPKCHVTGFPSPQITWSKDQGGLSARAVIQEGQLTVVNARRQDSGLYKCQASNVLGSDSSRTHLVVAVLPQFIVKPPKVLNVFEGEDVSGVCSATGDPSPTITWSKVNGNLPSGKSQVLANGVLKMTGLVKQDSGRYVCTATLLGTFKSHAGMQLNVQSPRSCKELRDAAPNRAKSNQAYYLKLESRKVQVYCHMTNINGCGSGGWTLVMKIDGSKNTFHYNSNYWSNKNIYNDQGGTTGLDNQETKLPTYWTTPFSKICLGMKVGGQTRFLAISQRASSLYSLIADGRYRATSLGRNAWKSLVPNSSLQPYCNREGFNAKVTNERFSIARIGITSNQENDCNSPDSRLGFGTGGYPDDSSTCGNEAKYGGDNGDRTIKTMGYIFVQ